MSAMLHDLGVPETGITPDAALVRLPVGNDGAIFLARRIDFDTV